MPFSLEPHRSASTLLHPHAATLRQANNQGTLRRGGRRRKEAQISAALLRLNPPNALSLHALRRLRIPLRNITKEILELTTH